MTDQAAATLPSLALPRFGTGLAVPVATVLLLVVVLWYVAAVGLNFGQVRNGIQHDGGVADLGAVIAGTMAMERPLLPAPHQIARELYSSIIEQSVTSKRSLIYHAGVTVSAAVAGFALGVGFGILLALGIVQNAVLDRSLMPWVIASQTVPVLAIAPMVVVVFGNLGFTGLLPKAVIAGYLSFFPITIGMVKGLRSPDTLQLDLMRTYSAAEGQVFAKLRWPAAMGFLFPSLKVAVSLALVGTIVAELPTGAQAGIGARLLAGSYYGQTIQIWSALFMAAFLAALGIGLVTLSERLLIRSRGGRL